jgi:hypothetical protein
VRRQRRPGGVGSARDRGTGHPEPALEVQAAKSPSPGE